MSSLKSIVAFAAALVLAGCGSTAPRTDSDRAELHRESAGAVAQFKQKRGMVKWFDRAAGYAIFPSVGKGGAVIGGAYGRGEVYDKDENLVGYTRIKQVTVGLQLGGQEYAEIILFEDETALKAFQEGNYELGAQASAIAIKAGASADGNYTKGVIVFTISKAGLMAEATVAGQKFDYTAK